MKVYLDDKPLNVDQPTVAAALRAGIAAADAARRIVIEATLNGSPIPGDQLSNPSESPAPGSEIRLTTAEPRALVATTLLDVADILPAAKETQQAAADAIHDGRMDDAMARLGESLQAWDQLRQVVDHSARLLDLKLSELRLGPPEGDGVSPSISQRAATLGNHLAEVKRSIQAQDWTGLADCLAYELDSQVDQWRAVLTDLAATVRPD